MNISLKEHAFKTFENPQVLSFQERMVMHQQFLTYLGNIEASCLHERLPYPDECIGGPH
ncbi:hypothetical protein [Sphingobacterium alkalisoli]|uniref:hypothetical protein n=1 Tax=Sphingobacterium alkalisoli TaxID=1874115 RepID=UPI00145E230A|nr:hypothetical protein [Sphingobacterium alkalisoli]